MRRAFLLFSFLLLPGATLQAQSERQTGFMVHQLSVCPGENMAEVNRISGIIAPILDQLQQEGMIRAWYDLRHSWGDEWNVGFVSIADSHRAWLDYWAEFLRRVNQVAPGEIAQMNTLCTLHKDNFYRIRDSRGGGD